MKVKCVELRSIELGELILFFIVMVGGYFAGSRLREVPEKLWWTGKVQTFIITTLVFLLGVRIGSNREAISDFGSIGFYAVIFTVVVLLFSIVATWVIRRLVGLDRYGLSRADREMLRETAEAAASGESVLDKGKPAGESTPDKERPAGPVIDRMTIYILCAVVTGLLCGYFIILEHFGADPSFDLTRFADTIGRIITPILCLLLFLIGVDAGVEGTVIDSFRNAGLRVLMLPLAVIVGTFSASLLMSVFLPVTVRECLAIGSGFAWYSIAPGIIIGKGHTIAGTISFIHNVLRELISILLIPTVAKRIGFIEACAMPGAAGMDVCLPMIERTTNSIVTIYSFINGVILTILVPVLVPLMLG